MARILAGVLVLAMVGVATAGIPDPITSVVDVMPLATKAGLSTCPIGDGPEFKYLRVTAKRTDGTPIVGIAWNNFSWTVTGGDVSILHEDVETDSNGEIRFRVLGDETIVWPTDLLINCQIYTVILADQDTLRCNTFDYDDNGWVNPLDLVQFGADWNQPNERSDFDWSGGNNNPLDLVKFGAHWNHGAP
jgi:hypothetical protein